MVSFKDKIAGRKIDFKETIDNGINSISNSDQRAERVESCAKLNGDACKRGGRIIDYKTHLPPTEDGTTPGNGGSGGAGDGVTTGCCIELQNRLDSIIDVLSKYKGGKFSSKVLRTKAATPVEIAFDNTEPSPDPKIIGFYDSIDVHNAKNPAANAEVLWVICDGPVSPSDPFLYVRTSRDRISFTQEIPVKLGEKWGFEDVYELRIRSTLQGSQYRLTEYDNQLTYVSVAVSTLPVFSTTPNRPNFIDLMVIVNTVDDILPSIVIPDGFALTIRNHVDNPMGSKIYTSRTDATTPFRNTLLPGDAKGYYITNANLIHVASSIDGLLLDISVEQ